MADSFRWLSPLGISVGLFTAIGALWILIGALTVPFHKRSTGSEMLFVSHSTDKAFFGASPSELLASNAALSKLRTLLLTVIAGFLLMAGATFVLLAWFGLRTGQAWSLAALGISAILGIIWWALALLPYFRSGIPVTIGDLPPFMWIPAVLILPAIILGWVGLR